MYDGGHTSLDVTLDGVFVKKITVREDSSKDTIKNAALKAVGKSYTQATVTHVPGKSANVVSVTEKV
jgi:hypothetical protein